MAQKDYPYLSAGDPDPPKYDRVVVLLDDRELNAEIDQAERYPEARADTEDWLAALNEEAQRRARQTRR